MIWGRASETANAGGNTRSGQVGKIKLDVILDEEQRLSR